MPDAVTDTHPLIWYLQDDPRLSEAASRCFDACQTDGGTIRVPSICVVEIIYLAEKERIPQQTLTHLLTELASLETVLEMAPLDMAVALKITTTARTLLPDLPDRIIESPTSQ